MRRLKQKRGEQDRHSNDESDNLNISQVPKVEHSRVLDGRPILTPQVERLKMQGASSRSSSPMSTHLKAVTSAENEVISGDFDDSVVEAQGPTQRAGGFVQDMQGDMLMPNVSDMLSVEDVASNAQVYRADDTCATPPCSEEVNHLLQQTPPEDAAPFAVGIEEESGTALNAVFDQFSDIDAPLTPCELAQVEQPPPLTRVVSNEPQDSPASIGHGSTQAKEPKRGSKISQKLKRKPVLESKRSPKQQGCLATPRANSRSLHANRVAKLRNSGIGGSPRPHVRSDVRGSVTTIFSEGSGDLVDDLEDMLTYASPISLYSDKKATVLRQLTSTSANSKWKRKRGILSVNKTPSLHSFHDDCSDDELIMSHEIGSGLTPVSKGQIKIEEDRNSVFNARWS